MLIYMHSIVSGSEGHGAFGHGDWISRSHFPYICEGNNETYHKVIFPIRNPIDLFYSLTALRTTNNHEMSIKPAELGQLYPELWTKNCSQESEVLAETI